MASMPITKVRVSAGSAATCAVSVVASSASWEAGTALRGGPVIPGIGHDAVLRRPGAGGQSGEGGGGKGARQVAAIRENVLLLTKC